VVDAKFGCLNFHSKHYKDNRPKLSLTVKNKLSTGWTKAWFDYRVPIHWSSKGGNNIYTLHSRMSALDFQVEPPLSCPDIDSNDAAFV
jgi:hypothetical protein